MAGSVETAGVQLHHLVWGIPPDAPVRLRRLRAPLAEPLFHLGAIAFGIGAGLTFDEFALWVHLEDVYWSQEGRRLARRGGVRRRRSAVLVSSGRSPFGLRRPQVESPERPPRGGRARAHLVTFMKDRIGLGVIAVFVAGVALWGALRLESRPRPGRAAATRARSSSAPRDAALRGGPAARQRRGRRVGDLIAGAPSNEE